MTGLATWRPWWDTTRRDSGLGGAFEDEDLTAATDFECGNGCNIRRVGSGRMALDLEPEPGEHRFSGESYYFCFGLRNKRSDAQKLTVELRNQGFPQWCDQTQHVVTRRGDAWGQLPREAIHGFPDAKPPRLELVVELPGCNEESPEMFCSNFHWYPYTDLRRDLQALAAAYSEIELSSLGKSHLGRDLYCAAVGPDSPEAPQIVLAQTPQPSEMGNHTCMALLRWLVGDDPGAERIRSVFRVSFLPNTNPDGTVLGYGVSDGRGRFPFFEADQAADGLSSATPETRAVWRHLASSRPWLFIEWHSNNWSRRPGHMLLRYEHELLDDKHRRAVWDAWEERMLAMPNTHHGNWTGHEQGLYQRSMGFCAVTRLGSIACMIKHHDKYEIRGILNHAADCFHAAIDAFDGDRRL